MTAHSLLFNAIVDREPAPRTNSPVFSARPSPALRSASYWDPEHGYSQYRTPSLPSLTHSPSTHSNSLSPPIDLNGLISMYEPSSPNPVFDPRYETEWSPPAQYPPYQQRNKQPAVWQSPSTDEYPQWNPMLNSLPEHSPHPTYSASSSATTSSCTSPMPYSSVTSSSASSTYLLNPASPLASTSTSAAFPRPSLPRNSTAPELRPKKECFHCHVTSTPLWRREPSTQRPLCNACGLYLQQRNRLRPQELIDADIDDGEPEIPDEEYTGPKCSHCGTRQTSVWRRNKDGQQVCNACGVYMRLRGKERPLSLKRNKIKPRTKHPR